MYLIKYYRNLLSSKANLNKDVDSAGNNSNKEGHGTALVHKFGHAGLAEVEPSSNFLRNNNLADILVLNCMIKPILKIQEIDRHGHCF
jgi:hypothetical protein